MWIYTLYLSRECVGEDIDLSPHLDPFAGLDLALISNSVGLPWLRPLVFIELFDDRSGDGFHVESN